MTIFATPPLPIIDLPADKQHASGAKLIAIDLIVIHATGGKDSRKWLSTDPDSDVSIQRLIMKDGTNYKIVEDGYQAHHVGRSRAGNELGLNDRTLGIELENWNNGRDLYPEAQLRMCAKQIVEWWGKYGFIAVTSHARIDTEGKSDPKGLDWTRLWQLVAEELGAVLGRGGVDLTDALRYVTDAQEHLQAAQIDLSSAQLAMALQRKPAAAAERQSEPAG